jgi:hypothetical protein
MHNDEAAVTIPGRQETYEDNDRQQRENAESERNLEYYACNGLAVVFPAAAKVVATERLAADQRDAPLFEKLKAERLLVINEFNDSRVMYAAHDMIDHIWLFSHLRETGITDTYRDFLQSIDLGEDAYLYSRQAELLASVGFGSRKWPQVAAEGVDLTLEEADLDALLGSADDPRAHAARERLAGMDSYGKGWARFVVQNMATQVSDERRRWGSVKQRDAVTGEYRSMRLLDPVYIALLIDSVDSVRAHEADLRQSQVDLSVQVEALLEAAIDDPESDTHGLILKSPPPVQISPEKVQWFAAHPHFAANYSKVG